MKRQLKNKINAVFLLIVFSLSTVAGFACSVGVDMGYNKHHHEHGKPDAHKHGKGHQHHRDTHAQLTKATSFFSSTKDDCCSNYVAKFTLLDKSVADNTFHLRVPVFLLAFTTTFLAQVKDVPNDSANSRFQFVRRSCFLNDTAIRIAIQSFQI